MKRKLLIIATCAFAVISLFNACKKGDVTQEDIIVDQQKVDLVIHVVNNSDGQQGVDSAVVEIITSGGTLTVSTDEAGVAFFEDIAISTNIPVMVTKTNFTSVTTTVSTVPGNYRQSQVSSTIGVYELTGPNVATVSGRLTVETDVTNREREAAPAGLVVKAYNYSMTNDVAFFGTTDEEGNYEISVPVSSYGNDDIELRYPEFVANQTVAIKNDEDKTIDLTERPVYYSLESNAKDNAIPGVPSVYATIEAPPSATAGSGLALSSVVRPTSLTSYTNVYLLNGGSGYTDESNALLDFSVGSNGDTAKLQVDIVGGRIVNIDGISNNGALYTSAPTINAEYNGGSGAEFKIEFRAVYNIVIDDNGSDYTTWPDVYYTYSYYTSNILYSPTSSFTLSSYTDLIGGAIINDNVNDGDTIYSFASATPPEFSVVDYPSRPIMLEITSNDINVNTGELTNIDILDIGYGYASSSPPAITFTTIAGYGSNAAATVNINTSSSLNTLVITNGGSEYVRNVNDFEDDGTTGDNEEDPGFSYNTYYDGFRMVYNVNPGEQFIRSAHYGTGIPVEEE